MPASRLTMRNHSLGSCYPNVGFAIGLNYRNDSTAMLLILLFARNIVSNCGRSENVT